MEWIEIVQTLLIAVLTGLKAFSNNKLPKKRVYKKKEA
jgi:hypothetical protein